LEQKSVFVRTTSGLVRPFGARDMTLIYTLLIVATAPLTVNIAWFWGFNPGADFVGSMVLATIATGLMMICYWAITLAMPRSGSDYVWFARIVHPSLGFTWSLVNYFMLLNVALVSVGFMWTMAISTTLTAWGTLYNAPGLVAVATWMSTSIGTFILVSVLMCIYAAIAILGHKVGKAILYSNWVFQVVAVVLIWGILWSANPNIFADKWNILMSNYATYQGVLDTAKSAGWAPTPITAGATLNSVTFTFFLMLGASIGAGTISGEVRNVNRSIPIALLLSTVFALLMWIITGLGLLNATGYNWMMGLTWMWDNGVATYPLPWAPSVPLMVGLLSYPNNLLAVVVLGTFILGSIGAIWAYTMALSRYFFAWGFDRLIPTKLADVNRRFNSPHWALVCNLVLALIITSLWTFTGFSYGLAASTTLMVIVYGILALTVAAFPFTKWKTLLEELPAFMRKRIAGVPFISLIGAVTAIVLFYAAYGVATNPLLTPVTAPLTAELFAIVVIVGLAIYYVAKWYNNRQGIDISLVFKEVPPT
jgi:amino acid transporter